MSRPPNDGGSDSEYDLQSILMELLYFSSGPRERVLAAVIAASHRILEVITTDPTARPQVAKTIAVAERHAIPVRVVSRDCLAGLAELVRDRVCLSVGFAYLFPEPLINAAALCLNVHGTLLPEYAGARTLNWVIANGEAESGITVHRIDAGVDTGPIMVQRPFPVSRFDTGPSLFEKTLALEPAVVIEALALVESGRAVYAPQDHTGVRRWPDRTPEHSMVDPARPLLELYDAIRASDPRRYPAYFMVDGQKVCIKLWRPTKPESDEYLL